MNSAGLLSTTLSSVLAEIIALLMAGPNPGMLALCSSIWNLVRDDKQANQNKNPSQKSPAQKRASNNEVGVNPTPNPKLTCGPLEPTISFEMSPFVLMSWQVELVYECGSSRAGTEVSVVYQTKSRSCSLTYTVTGSAKDTKKSFVVPV